MFKKNKIFLSAIFFLLFIIIGYAGFKVHTLSEAQEAVKEDYATANSISFGLLSVNQWRDQIEEIITHQIQNFDFSQEQKEQLEKEIEEILHALIDKTVKAINKPKKSLKGKLSKFAFNTFVDEDELHKQVPAYAHEIVAQIDKPSSKKRLKDIAQSKVQELGKQIYDSTKAANDSLMNIIYKKYQVANANEYEKKTETLLIQLRKEGYNYAFAMVGCIALTLLAWWILRKRPELHKSLFLFCVATAAIVLVIGLTTTMIEVDARISSINFYLLGDSISFKNQVLFFQSKSIFDVVRILIDTGKYDSIIVGILILSFSILFPLGKLFSAAAYVSSEKKWARNKFTSFFAFKSGKWSMADVMVVAILMTYIGFNGIVESQLKSLNIHTQTLTSITTNNTSLQPGYIVFVLFVLYGLFLSVMLKHITGKKQE